MAKRISIDISDDTDGSHADQTVPFGLDGVTYEIDLSNANAGSLRAAMEPYVSAARRTGGRRIKVAVGQPTQSTKEEPEESTDYAAAHDIRAWARQNGYEVADQGRISKSIVEAFHSSRQESKTKPIQEPRIATKPKRRTRRSK
ncbi:histone-like nucleoid-structuring protein Lsr2 [Amycolatopsis kentuckyensis]|uniref:histone-like nucleoid-structuring protein Lsr2 n=1 Tax=Amycolatopsis kentuckyensis TaxID=218823 RepID=UPI0035648755